MTLRKEIPLFDSRRRLVLHYPYIVTGTMHYPKCVSSILHFANVMGSDSEVDYSFESELSKTVQASIRGRKTQGHAAGEVALRLLEMGAEKDAVPSVNKACHIVSAAVQDIEIDGRPYRPRTFDTVRQAYYEFKPSCHLWAASCVATDHLAAGDQSDEDMAKFLGVAEMLQESLKMVMQDPRSPWDPWNVPIEFTNPDLSFEIPGLSSEMKDILSCYIAAGR